MHGFTLNCIDTVNCVRENAQFNFEICTGALQFYYELYWSQCMVLLSIVLVPLHGFTVNCVIENAQFYFEICIIGALQFYYELYGNVLELLQVSTVNCIRATA